MSTHELTRLLIDNLTDQAVLGALRRFCFELGLGGGAANTPAELVERIGAAIDKRVLYAYKSLKGSINETIWQIQNTNYPGFIRDNTPVPLLTDAGTQVKNMFGEPVLRPKTPGPNFFVAQGLMKNSEIATPVVICERILDFRQSRMWDMQRYNGEFYSKFVDYATIVIGLYMSARGVPRIMTLICEELYASIHSNHRYSAMDRVFSSLPVQNVFNTNLGYQLYESGAVGPRDKN